MELNEVIKNTMEFQQLAPIVEQGFEGPMNFVGREPIFWFGWPFRHQEAFTFESGKGANVELLGVRLFCSQEICYETENGTVEVSTELYLKDNGGLTKFYTFREFIFCEKCRQNHILVRRMVARNQTLSENELNGILRSNLVSKFRLSQYQDYALNKKDAMINCLTPDQRSIIKTASKLVLPPVLKDGYDVEELYDEKAYSLAEYGEPRWLDADVSVKLADAGDIFRLSGMRVLYSPKIQYETVNGYAEFSEEVFLDKKGNMVKFYTFRDATAYLNQEKHIRLHRVVAKDQSLSDDEMKSILNSVSTQIKHNISTQDNLSD